jgi:hypothetical protein
MDMVADKRDSVNALVTRRRVRLTQSAVTAVFGLTLFLSAGLLFSVQPMVAKMLLPLLGGTPAVWNTCMVFFQGLLLAGYAYAMFISRRSAGQQIVFQLVLLLLACVSLPIGLSAFWLNSVPANSNPAFWLLACLGGTVGLPFFITSSNGPLLQKWFSNTGFRSSTDPYFLYSASNAGSFVALLSYPVLLEPNFNLQLQSRIWAIGYLLLISLIAVCAFLLWRSRAGVVEIVEPDYPAVSVDNVPSTGKRLRWIALAFVPSSLMLGVTNYLTTDIASLPLLWVVPLAIYLFTLVLAFSRHQVISLRSLTIVLPAITVLFLFVYFSRISIEPTWMIALSLIYFFIAALTCHTRVAALRPGPKHLTEFYLWFSLGGVLGGIFNAVLAPLIFTSVVEYPLIVLLACLLLPGGPGEQGSARLGWKDYAKPAAILVGTLVLAVAVNKLAPGSLSGLVVVLALPMIVAYTARHQPLIFVLCIAAVIVGSTLVSVENRTLHVERNFFGVLRVTSNADDSMHAIFHDSTIHGREFTSPQRRCDPISYFHREGPLGYVFTAFRESPAPRNVAVVGLGAGAIFAHAVPSENWTYYEINPAVVEIARDKRYFSYVGECAQVPFNVVLGDARLRLREAPDATYGLIVMDAFSSDAIPVHLITQQALDLYLSKLAPGGLLAFHISNRNLDLRPVVADLATSRNLTGIYLEDKVADPVKGKDPSGWVVMTRKDSDNGALAKTPIAYPLIADGKHLWTDDFSNILSVFRWR